MVDNAITYIKSISITDIAREPRAPRSGTREAHDTVTYYVTGTQTKVKAQRSLSAFRPLKHTHSRISFLLRVWGGMHSSGLPTGGAAESSFHGEAVDKTAEDALSR